MEENQPASKQSQTFLAGSIIVAALIVGGALVYSTGVRSLGDDSLARVGDSTVTPEGAANVSVDDDVVLGDAEAPVTFVSFGDFQCPYCERMYRDTETKLREEYIKTGKVKMVFRDFPLDSIHPFARSAAEAAQCAKDQGKYWLYHDALYDRQAQIPTLNFVTLAGELGLDTAQFGACVQEEKYADEVEKDLQDGIAAGVTGTPGNFVNGKAFHGALPYATFKAAIEEALKESEKSN